MPLTDDEVTRAARALTDVEPTPGLERRILARLDAVTPVPRRRLWPWAAGLATTAATAAAVLGLMVAQPPTPRPSVQPSAHLATNAPAQPSTHALAQPPTQPSAARPRVVRLPDLRVGIPEDELAWMARQVPTLEPIALIQPEPVVIAPIHIPPLGTR